MNLKELKKPVASGESDRLEFKTSTGQRTQAMKTVCGMLNCLGGFVLFGVSDKGELVGQDVTVKTMADISVELNRIAPPAFPDVRNGHAGKWQSRDHIKSPRRRVLYLCWPPLYPSGLQQISCRKPNMNADWLNACTQPADGRTNRRLMRLGYSGAEVARYLGVTISCITRAVLSFGKPNDAESLIRDLCTPGTIVIAQGLGRITGKTGEKAVKEKRSNRFR